MATASSHTPAESSIPPSLLKAHERIRQLESENLRLRHLLDTRREQIEELAPGYYNLTDDGDFNGPARSLDEIESCVTDYTNDGDACYGFVEGEDFEKSSIISCSPKKTSGDFKGLQQPPEFKLPCVPKWGSARISISCVMRKEGTSA